MNESRSTSRLLAWLQLCRAPNVFTAMADIAMGFLFVSGAFAPVAPFLLLLAASSLLYTAGMVLNDVYDFEQDTRDRPHRPLPSGRISRATATRLGYAMLLWGLVAGWLAGWSGQAALPWRSGVVATLLAGCIVLYDSFAKRTPLGPLVMGACRLFNVLLGMSAAGAISSEHALAAGYDAAQLLTAGGIGLYIVGVTWFARTEARAKSSWLHLLAASVTMMGGIALLAAWPHVENGPPLQIASFKIGPAFSPPGVWAVFLALIALPVLAHCVAAVFKPIPQRVQIAVKRAIFSLIMFDAAVSLSVAGPEAALFVLALLIPTMTLGSWVYAT